MPLAYKKIITVFVSVFLFFHFLFIAVYSSPFSQLPSKLKAASDRYVYPYFQQHWGLFVPAPKKEYHLYRRFKFQNKWSPWNDVFTQYQITHKANVTLGNESYVLLYSTVLNYAFYALDGSKQLYVKPPSTIEFDILKHTIKKQYALEHQTYSEFELIIVVNENKQSQAFYFKNLF